MCGFMLMERKRNTAQRITGMEPVSLVVKGGLDIFNIQTTVIGSSTVCMSIKLREERGDIKSKPE